MHLGFFLLSICFLFFPSIANNPNLVSTAKLRTVARTALIIALVLAVFDFEVNRSDVCDDEVSEPVAILGLLTADPGLLGVAVRSRGAESRYRNGSGSCIWSGRSARAWLCEDGFKGRDEGRS